MNLSQISNLSKSFVKSTIFRFLLIGVWNTAFGLILFTILLSLLGQARYQTAFWISSAISVVQAFIMQRLVVWKSSNAMSKEFFRFATTYAVTIGLNYFLLATAVTNLDFDPLISQYLITAALVVASYFANRYWVFNSR